MKTATPPSRPGPTEFADEMSDAAAGIGLWTTILFGTVPGFLPIVALTILAGAIFVIPIVVLVAVAGLPLLVARIASWAFSLVARGHRDTEHSRSRKRPMVRAEPEAALH